MKSIRVVAVISAAAAILAAPVFTPVWAAARPVAPTVHRTPIGGVDAAALQSAPAAFDPAGVVAAESASGTAAPTTAVPRVTNTKRPAVLTTELDPGRFTATGLTWSKAGAPADVVVQIRVRENGNWSDWQSLSAADGAPDPGTADAAGAAGRVTTEPYTTGDADAVQLRVDSAGSVAPPKLTLLTVDPGTSAADANLAGTPAATAQSAVARPAIISRAQWGADESLRTCTASYSPTIKVGFVHHTAGSNSYTAAQSAGIVRGIYAFHVQGNGWCDVGYNFLVDRYGQVFEGRGGGTERPVIGAHTLAFNYNSFSVSAMGTFDTAAPPAAMLNSMGRVLGWKLSMHGRNPAGTDVLTSAGGTGAKWPAGTVVRFNVVSGHRDAYATGCPGNLLYPQLANLRSIAATYIAQNDVRQIVPPVLNGNGLPVRSPGNRYRLNMQDDGNLVIYDNSTGRALWSALTNVAGGYLKVQSDGNVVIYDGEDDFPVWATMTTGAGNQLRMQDDGNLVLYSASGKALWDRAGVLKRGVKRFLPKRKFSSLASGQSVYSHSNAYRLSMQSDGNLVEYTRTGAVVWATMTNIPGSRLMAQSDGNVVMYAPDGGAVWHTALYSPGAYILIQDDGNVVVWSAAGKALWDSKGTTGHRAIRLR